MNDAELKKIVDAWIIGQDAEEGPPERQANWWAIDQVMDWEMKDKSDLLWQFILVAYKRDMTDNVLSVLAAGPLEDLLAKFGPRYIDRVEKLAKEDSRFNFLLGGVWKNTMTDEVWQRIEAVREKVW